MNLLRVKIFCGETMTFYETVCLCGFFLIEILQRLHDVYFMLNFRFSFSMNSLQSITRDHRLEADK